MTLCPPPINRDAWTDLRDFLLRCASVQEQAKEHERLRLLNDVDAEDLGEEPETCPMCGIEINGSCPKCGYVTNPGEMAGYITALMGAVQ